MKSNELLNSLHTDVLSIIQTVQNEFSQLSFERLNWKETAESWSILECLAHLNKYSGYYNKELSKSIGKVLQNDPTVVEVRATWLGRKFINMMHPDNTQQQKTFQRMNPVTSELEGDVIDKFLGYQNELLLMIRQASHTDLNNAYIPVEFMKLLKMNLGNALQFVIVHEQRHINQARRVKSKTEQLKEPALKI